MMLLGVGGDLYERWMRVWMNAGEGENGADG